eukprot:TRINITY_DN107293_c1_g1_i4.p4 TRINITY_DN107293_c1_g1~~TRINITY_DN107293_c1_g1_i4.p4  ORF type:complete len:124 (+),score=4.15 TRINITY_DN107293_c1_g1_i4:125-496(+)
MESWFQMGSQFFWTLPLLKFKIRTAFKNRLESRIFQNLQFVDLLPHFSSPTAGLILLSILQIKQQKIKVLENTEKNLWVPPLLLKNLLWEQLQNELKHLRNHYDIFQSRFRESQEHNQQEPFS